MPGQDPSTNRYITMPALSSTMEQGTLVRWLVKEGAAFKAGDALAEIETDKSVLTLEAPEDGAIAKILVSEGTEGIEVGAPLADLGQRDPPEARSGMESPERVLASPLARKLARESGVDLGNVRGSGPRGRVRATDVVGTESRAADPERVPLTPMRRAIAERLTASKQSVPHAYLTVDIHMDALTRLRGELNERMPGGARRLSLNDFMIRAMALALAESPRVNVQFSGDHLLRFHQVDLAVAVAIDDGLITPVIRSASQKGVEEISVEMADLAARARSRNLRPAEYAGGTACLSNLGNMGIKQFEAIINPPHTIILAVGSVEKRAAVIEDSLVIARQLTATASFDHRAMDGRDCAEFLSRFKEMLERPAALTSVHIIRHRITSARTDAEIPPIQAAPPVNEVLPP